MFPGDSQMLRNNRYFILSVIAINIFYCTYQLETNKDESKHVFINIVDDTTYHTCFSYSINLIMEQMYS